MLGKDYEKPGLRAGPDARGDRGALDAADHPRRVLRRPALLRAPGPPRHPQGGALRSPLWASSRTGSSSADPTPSTRGATCTSSPPRAATCGRPSASCWRGARATAPPILACSSTLSAGPRWWAATAQTATRSRPRGRHRRARREPAAAAPGPGRGRPAPAPPPAGAAADLRGDLGGLGGRGDAPGSSGGCGASSAASAAARDSRRLRRLSRWRLTCTASESAHRLIEWTIVGRRVARP